MKTYVYISIYLNIYTHKENGVRNTHVKHVKHKSNNYLAPKLELKNKFETWYK